MSTNKLRFGVALTMVSALAALTVGACATTDTDDPGAIDDQKTSALTPPSITQFTKVFVIGDSLSDTHRIGEGLIPKCPNSLRGYWDNRFSNGYLWIDYLTQDNPGLAGKVVNYAVGGSGVLRRYGSYLIGRTEKQAQDLVAENPASVVTNSLVIVWAGANDIKEAPKKNDPNAFAQSLFDRLRSNTIGYLLNQGVEHFVLVGLPRLDLVPQGQSWTAAQQHWAEVAVGKFNALLKDYAISFGHVYVPIAAKIAQIRSGEVTSVNMTDLTNPCWDGVNCIEQGDIPGRYTDKRCTGKMFFDRVHPTTTAHCGIAKWFEQAISTQYAISGGDDDLETCARRAQTEEAQWGLPANHSQPRAVHFRVQTRLNPTDVSCQAKCFQAGGAVWRGTKDSVTLPSGTEVGYCDCRAISLDWPLTFKSDGKDPDKTCFKMNEPGDPDTWNDNYLCDEDGTVLSWSYDGPVDGLRCTLMNEPNDPHGWNDNYLCVPPASPHHLDWSSTGPIPGKACVDIYEAADHDGWDDNYLCVDRGLQWSSSGPIADKSCVQITEPADPDSWSDNYLCADMPFGINWSSSGPIAGMRCTQIHEKAEPASHGWTDNYLCVPPASSLHFAWSNNGPVAGKTCVKIEETSDPNAWHDNYLCY